MTDNLAALDEIIAPEQGQAFRRALTAGDPREGLAIVHRLTQPSAQMSAQEKLQISRDFHRSAGGDYLPGSRLSANGQRSISQQYEARYQERAEK